MQESKDKVSLHVYDLSGGMAAQFSQMLTGKYFEGIWHTGIVVRGREYFFGGGIFYDAPGRTPYGTPHKVIELGYTKKTLQEFEAWVDSARPRFRMEDYNLLDHNCNNFTNEASLFLVGKGIPQDIIDLPQQALNTPIGQMLRPMIEAHQQRMTDFMGTNQAPGTATTTTTTSSSPAFNATPFASGGFPSGGAVGSSPVAKQAHDGAVLASLPPWPPALQADHPHAALILPITSTKKPTLYWAAVSGKAVAKIAEDDAVQLSPTELSALKELAAVLDEQAKSRDLAKITCMPDISTLLVLGGVACVECFPTVDILRQAVINPNAAKALLEHENPTIAMLFQLYLSLPDVTKGEVDSHRGFRIVVLRLAANLFATAIGTAWTLRHAAIMAEVVVKGLHEDDSFALLAASTLALNMAPTLPRSEADSVVQVVSALVHYLQNAADQAHESVFLCLAALSKTIYGNQPVAQLAGMLGFDAEAFQRQDVSPPKVRAVSGELSRILAASQD